MAKPSTSFLDDEDEPFDAAAFQAELDLSYGLSYEIAARIFPRRDGSTKPPAPPVDAQGRVILPFELRPERLGAGAVPKQTGPRNEAEKRLQAKLDPVAAAARRKLEAEAASAAKALVEYASEEDDESESRSKSFASTSKTALPPPPPAIPTVDAIPEEKLSKKARKRKRKREEAMLRDGSVSTEASSAPSAALAQPLNGSLTHTPASSPPPSPGKVPYAPAISPTASADEDIVMPKGMSSEDEAEEEAPTATEGAAAKRRKRRKRQASARKVDSENPTATA